MKVVRLRALGLDTALEEAWGLACDAALVQEASRPGGGPNRQILVDWRSFSETGPQRIDAWAPRVSS